MNSFVTQIVCGERWPDFQDNGWFQLLVFVILVVIYMLSSIVKTKKSSKTESSGCLTAEQEQEPASGVLRNAVRHPPAETGQRLPARGARKQRIAEIQPHPVPISDASQTTRQVTIRPAAEWTEVVGQILDAVTEQATHVCAESPAVPIVQFSPLSSGEAEVKAKSSQVAAGEPKFKKMTTPPVVVMPENLYDILPDFADPEKVRKVILHYEILGKPLSLREPPDNIIES